MKTTIKLLGILLVFGIFFTSCNNEDEPTKTENLTAEQLDLIVDAEVTTDEINSFFDKAYNEEESTSKTDQYGFFPKCATKTIEVTATTKTITIDFGTEGCETHNGHVVSGKMILFYEIDFDAMTTTITQTFEEFTFNRKTIDGTSTRVRVKENLRGNPESTITFDITVTWESGESISRVGTKVREWVEGYGTGDWGDDVFLITGNWTVTLKDGTIVSADVVEALRRELACKFIVSGIVNLQKGDVIGVLDFGDGTCDNQALFTSEDGTETIITLK